MLLYYYIRGNEKRCSYYEGRDRWLQKRHAQGRVFWRRFNINHDYAQKLKSNVNSYEANFVNCKFWCLDSLKWLVKIDREKAIEHKKQETRLKFNPGLAMNGLRM